LQTDCHISHQYIFDFALTLASQSNSTFNVLDYGCGAGELISLGRGRGMNFFGADLFYAEGEYGRQEIDRKGWLGTIVRELRSDGSIDFPSCFFDLVVSNQVFEHVENLDLVLSQIFRVLKPGGKLLSIFPCLDTWREAHCHIPFVHRFPKSKLRIRYMLLMSRVGFGDDPVLTEQSARNSLEWIDTYCFYRRRREILETFRRLFRVQSIEDNYIDFRLSRHPRLRRLVPLVRFPLFKPFAKALLRKVGFLVLVAEKPL
jgi:SAM-dependent methyltransferase